MSILDSFVVCVLLGLGLRYLAPNYVPTRAGKALVRRVSLLVIPMFVVLVIWHIASVRNDHEVLDDEIVTHFAQNGVYH